MAPPTVCIVPGIWEGPDVFDPLKDQLEAKGYKVHVTHLLSTGTELAQAVEEAGADGVVALLHSAAGFLMPMAMTGLSSKARAAEGKTGGVRSIVFLVAAVVPEGTAIKAFPTMEFHGYEGYHVCRDPRNAFFNDFSDDEAAKWIPRMEKQPSEDWDKTVDYCGWREVPSVYIETTADRVLPTATQEAMATLAGSEIVKLEGAGHMAQLSRTAEIADIIDKEAKTWALGN